MPLETVLDSEREARGVQKEILHAPGEDLEWQYSGPFPEQKLDRLAPKDAQLSDQRKTM